LLEFIRWNPPLVLAIFALTAAQIFKFSRTLLLERRVDFTRLTGMGGMPSSHAAAVAALSTAVGLETGWTSTLFGSVAFVSLLIIYDATGIRQAASSQARLLNQILEDLKAHHTIRGERVVESLGHTVLEVTVGAAFGVAVALALYP
jgi:acid phosphatase family membrane protein YuiD